MAPEPKSHNDQLIDLNRGMSTSLSEQQDLQRKLWDTLKELLEPTKTTAQTSDQEDSPFTPASLRVSQDRSHEAIFLTGRRGEGKTTVLLQILGKIERGEWKDYRSLGLLDPTLLESKQNLILSIIQRIREYLISDEISWKHRSQSDESDLKKAQNALRTLAKGISVLDGVGSNDLHDEDWSNASFIMDEGMERAEAAYSFEQSFRDFVSCAAKAVGCEAFVICIDDVDTKSEMGAPVLEALRKYLTSPKLRVVVSGDPELLQSLTRKIQLNGMGEDFVRFERKLTISHPESSRIETLLEQLSGLEDQFITKVLPPHRRIKLQTLNEITTTKDTSINLKWKNRADDETPLNEELNTIIGSHWGARDANTLRLYRSAILSMPVRSIIEFLEVWDVRGTNPTPAEVSERMTGISRSQLAAAGLRIDSIQNIPDFTIKLRRIVEWMCEEPTRWDEFSNLTPDGAHESKDRATLALSSIISGGLQNTIPGTIRYWLLFAAIGSQVESEGFVGHDNRKGNLAKFRAHIRFMQDQPLRDFLAYWAAWERSPKSAEKLNVENSTSIFGIPVATDRVRNSPKVLKQFYGFEYQKGDWNKFYNVSSGVKNGNILTLDEIAAFVNTLPKDLQGFHQKISEKAEDANIYGKGQSRLSGALFNSIEELAARVDDTSASIALLPYTKIISGQGYDHGNYGILPILAGIDDLISNEDKEAVLASWQGTPIAPTATRKELSDQEVDADYVHEDDENSKGEASQFEFDPDFVKALKDWAETNKDLKPVSAVSLASCWKTFSDAAPKVFKTASQGQNTISKNKFFLGSILHRELVVFLHSLGVEMYRREGGQANKAMQNSPTGSDENFINLLKHMRDTQIRSEVVSDSSEVVRFENMPGGALFYHFLKCPLWRYYLEPSLFSEVEELNDTAVRHATYTPPGVRKGTTVTFDGLYYLLNTVPIIQGDGR